MSTLAPLQGKTKNSNDVVAARKAAVRPPYEKQSGGARVRAALPNIASLDGFASAPEFARLPSPNQDSAHDVSQSPVWALHSTRFAPQVSAAIESLPIQTKLEVSQPGDALEQEADRVAESVMRTPLDHIVPQRQEDTSLTASSRAQVVQRACSSCTTTENDEEPLVQRSADAAPRDGQASTNWSQRLRAAQSSGGEPLPRGVRQFMEPRFGATFGHVKVHHGQTANVLNRQVAARAFTVGRDIFFNQGEFAPDTERGQRLIAHELTHVVQQSARRIEMWPQVTPVRNATFVQRQTEDFMSGGQRVSYLADDIVAGRITDSGTLVSRLRDFSRDELNELLAQVDYNASQRLSSDPVLDGLIEAAKEEIRGALAGRVILKPLPPCTQSYAPPSPAAFAADIELQRVREGDLVLRPGVSSEGTLLVQYALRSFGCAVISKDLLPRFGTDGSYGDETARAVREFQTARGLSVDGTVGPNTIAALDAFVGVNPDEPTELPCTVHGPRYPADMSEAGKNRIRVGAGLTQGEGCARQPYWAGERSMICTIGYGHVIRPGESHCTVNMDENVIVGHDCDRAGSGVVRHRCDCTPSLTYNDEAARRRLDRDIAGTFGWIQRNIRVDFVAEGADPADRAALQAAFDAFVDLLLQPGGNPFMPLAQAFNEKCCSSLIVPRPTDSPQVVRANREKFYANLAELRALYIRQGGHVLVRRREERWPSPGLP